MIKKVKIKIPLWMQIVLILIIGIIASASVYLISQEINSEKFVVKFAYLDGSIIEEKKVKSGEGVMPPKLESDEVFLGWSAAINNIESDIEVHPQFYNIVEDNLFYFDSQYVKEGKNVKIDIYVGGNVNFNKGELSIDYDNAILNYKKSNCADGVSVSNTEDGKITISINSSSPIKEKTLLTSITLSSQKADVFSTEILLTATNVTYVENGKDKPAVFATINNKIYFLQEVS